MIVRRKRKCKHCGQFFRPDPRNIARQRYCSQPGCKKASKAASQEKWLKKPQNQDYFRSDENVARVQEWRRRNPGYWRKKEIAAEPLQDHSISEIVQDQDVTVDLATTALQDLLSVQDVVLLGLLAHLSDSALQDDIVNTGRRLQQLGQDILSKPFDGKGGHYDSQQTAYPSTHDPPDPRTV
jgi:hypothetical protein